MQERLEAAAQQEAAAEALRQELLAAQREAERARSAATAQRAALETAQAQVRGSALWGDMLFIGGGVTKKNRVQSSLMKVASTGRQHNFCGLVVHVTNLKSSCSAWDTQVEREKAALAQERSVLMELRAQRLGEQESLIAGVLCSLQGAGG